MKILVTGGVGYIGSHTVVELHNAGYQPVIIDNLSNSLESVCDGIRDILNVDIPAYKDDCNDPEAVNGIMEMERIEGVIHFAAYKAVGESVREPLKYYGNNIHSTVNLLAAMKNKNIANFVFSSSCTVYGQPEQLPVTEASPTLPAESPYGNTKQICEEILRDTVKSGTNLRAIALRYFNPVGAHPTAHIGELPLGTPNNLVPFITQTAAGWREQLTVFGNDYNTPDGTCVRDYIHVVDLAKAHVKALDLLSRSTEPRSYDFYNVGTGRGNTVLEVIHTFEEVSGVKLNYKIGPRRGGDVEQVYANVEKVNSQLGWQAEKSLREGLADAWRWQQRLVERGMKAM